MNALGPFRLEAIASSQKGWCACCDELPIKRSTTRGRPTLYTCGRDACKAIWMCLCSADNRLAKKARAA